MGKELPAKLEEIQILRPRHLEDSGQEPSDEGRCVMVSDTTCMVFAQHQTVLQFSHTN